MLDKSEERKYFSKHKALLQAFNTIEIYWVILYLIPVDWMIFSLLHKLNDNTFVQVSEIWNNLLQFDSIDLVINSPKDGWPMELIRYEFWKCNNVAEPTLNMMFME